MSDVDSWEKSTQFCPFNFWWQWRLWGFFSSNQSKFTQELMDNGCFGWLLLPVWSVLLRWHVSKAFAGKLLEIWFGWAFSLWVRFLKFSNSWLDFIYNFGLFLVEGVMLGCAVTAFSADEVLMAVGITVVLVLGLTLFALQTKIDFTACGAALLMMVLCLMLFGLCIWFFPNNKIVNIVYASLGAFIFR